MTATLKQVECEQCHRGIVLECEGLTGPAGYETFNEFFCPHCKKQNHARTPGAIASVRAA